MPYIIVGIDGSECAEAALEAAVSQAALIDAELRVVSVVTLPVMSGYEFGPVDMDHMRAAAERLLDSAVDRLDGGHGGDMPVKVTTDVLTGHVGIEILRAAKADDGAAMVVVGSRGYGAIKSMLLGSVTTYLAHHLSCPLLVIPCVDNE